ncbi:MAG: hypothetical protein IKQ45_08055 [Clostridia bacterium]|nr:hypothetical protein [Clostridia bacterium]
MSDSMPILRRACSGGKKYENVVLLNINHDLKNSYCFSAALAGLFGKVIQVGASYASSTREDRKPFAGGVYYYAVHNRNKTFSLQRSEVPLRIRAYSFVDSMDMLITVAVARDVLPEIRAGRKLFIIEDGGYHPATIDNLEEIWPELRGNIIGSVEQTTSGTRILSSRTHYNYPSVSIARSEIKMCLESVFIGQRIVEELSTILAHTDHFLNYTDVCVVGYGIFGLAVVRKLESYRCRITVCDTDEVIREAAAREGYPACGALTADVFRSGQIIIAMTGNKSFGTRELEEYFRSDADGILLSSGSSKDIEFRDILDLIRDPGDSGFTFAREETGPYYEKYAVSKGGRQKTFWLIAGGMPLNFCREGSVSLTDRMIDLIFAEMALCAAAVIDSGNLPNGLYLLGDKDAPVQLDEWALMREWFEINGLNRDGDPEKNLCIHPCREYLRGATFRKLSMNNLL